MYARLKDALTAPQFLIDYKNDKLIRVLLYLLVFLLFTSVGALINVVTYDGFENIQRDEIKTSLESFESTCYYNGYVLECADENYSKISLPSLQLEIIVDGSSEVNTANYELEYNQTVVLNKDKMYFYLSGVPTTFESNVLSNSFENLDFRSDSYDDSLQFSNTIIDSIDETTIQYKTLWGSIAYFGSFIVNSIILIIIIFINVLIVKSRSKVVKVKELFILTTYSATGLYLLFALDGMITLNLILYIVLVFLAFSRIFKINMEVYKRVDLYNLNKSKIDKLKSINKHNTESKSSSNEDEDSNEYEDLNEDENTYDDEFDDNEKED